MKRLTALLTVGLLTACAAPPEGDLSPYDSRWWKSETGIETEQIANQEQITTQEQLANQEGEQAANPNATPPLYISPPQSAPPQSVTPPQTNKNSFPNINTVPPAPPAGTYATLLKELKEGYKDETEQMEQQTPE